MIEDNNHIDDFLKYYCKLTAPPQYAVMLKGKWGSGKTHYINRLKKKLIKIDKKYFYVSLYGAKTNSEILSKILKNDIFQKIDKKINNGKINQGISWFKEIASEKLLTNKLISNEVLQMKILESYNDFEKSIFIFDDLERCEAPINQVLGFINIFTEHKSSKVIVLANEDELYKNNKDYQRIKEKLIGKTFEIVSEVNLAYENFIKKLDNKSTFKRNKKIILDIYKQSKYNNLRLLRQTILDFDRFYTKALKKYLNKELIEDIIKQYFLFSIEHKKNGLNILELDNYESKYWEAHNKDNEKEKELNIYNKLNIKYKIKLNSSTIFESPFFNNLFDLKQWDKIITNSIIDTKDIDKNIKSSIFYIDKDSELWKQLYYFYNLEDNAFNDILKKVEDEFKICQYANIHILRHIYSIFIFLIDNGLYKKNKEDILIKLKENIDSIYKNKEIKKSDFLQPSREIYRGYDGLNYLKISKEDSKIFYDYIDKKLQEVNAKELTNIANILIDNLDSEDAKNIDILILGDEDNPYNKKPLLKFIDIDKFIKKFMTIDNKYKRYFGYILSYRYEESNFLDRLVEEIDFLKDLKTKLTTKHNNIDGEISKYNIMYFIETYLQKAINDLQQYIDIKEENK